MAVNASTTSGSFLPQTSLSPCDDQKVRPWPAFIDPIMRSFNDRSFKTLLIQYQS